MIGGSYTHEVLRMRRASVCTWNFPGTDQPRHLGLKLGRLRRGGIACSLVLATSRSIIAFSKETSVPRVSNMLRRTLIISSTSLWEQISQIAKASSIYRSMSVRMAISIFLTQGRLHLGPEPSAEENKSEIKMTGQMIHLPRRDDCNDRYHPEN